MSQDDDKKIKVGRPAGFRDFYPEDYAKVDFVLQTMRRISLEFGYVEYVTPAVELRKLYELKSGEGLIKETFKIESRSGQKLVLIPELTPSLSRILAERQQYYTKPIRWFSFPKCYRDETLQRGRVKEFWQFNADILGEEDIYADAEIITILVKIIKECGLSSKQFVVKINDRKFMQGFMDQIGVKNFLPVIQAFDRKDKLLQEQIEKELKGKFSEDETTRIALAIRQNKNLDKTIFDIIPKTKETESIVTNYDNIRKNAFIKNLLALNISDKQAEILYQLSEIEDIPKNFIKRVKDLGIVENIDYLLSDLLVLAKMLDDFGVQDFISYDGSLARGLDYYTGVIFEAWNREGVLPRAIAGGGRYADLVATIGGQSLTGTGFGFGETVLMELMDEFGINYPKLQTCDIYIAPIQLEDYSKVIDLATKLREKGLKVLFNPFNWRIKRHFENAEKQGVEWMLIIGKKDLADNVVTLRNIINGEQETIPIKNIVNLLTKKIKRI
ncbi:MAG: histidine--tRNA ligase [Candidatus Heimdallarchaeota archaeon]|nr:histidine--tRNA ligase [Candidatus Heimdallarchaeota archaeon]